MKSGLCVVGLSQVGSLDLTHNPKVGGSNPPPATTFSAPASLLVNPDGRISAANPQSELSTPFAPCPKDACGLRVAQLSHS